MGLLLIRSLSRAWFVVRSVLSSFAFLLGWPSCQCSCKRFITIHGKEMGSSDEAVAFNLSPTLISYPSHHVASQPDIQEVARQYQPGSANLQPVTKPSVPVSERCIGVISVSGVI